jgi:hypothetical protein
MGRLAQQCRIYRRRGNAPFTDLGAAYRHHNTALDLIGVPIPQVSGQDRADQIRRPGQASDTSIVRIDATTLTCSARKHRRYRA